MFSGLEESQALPCVALEGGEGQEGSLAWTFRRNRVKSRAVLIRQDGCDWGPSGVKIVCTGLPRVKRTLDFSGIFFGYFSQKYAKSTC